MDVSGRILAVLLAVLLLTIFPLQYIASNIENSVDSHIDHDTEQLSDTIRTKGYLDVGTYEDFIERLDLSGDIYDIEIEDIHPVTGEEVAAREEGQNVNLAYYEDADVIDKKTNDNFSLNLSKERITEKVFEKSSNTGEIQSFATHTHTDACYSGHSHAVSGCLIAGKMDIKVRLVALNHIETPDYERLELRVYCGNCYDDLYWISYFKPKTPTYGTTMSFNCVYSRVLSTGAPEKISTSGNIPVSNTTVTNAISSSVNTLFNKLPNVTNQVDLAWTYGDFPVIDNSGNVSMRPFIGCPYEIAATGPVVPTVTTNGSNGYVMGQYQYYSELKHSTCGTVLATIGYNEGSSYIYEWKTRSLTFAQRVYLVSGQVSRGQNYIRAKEIPLFLTSPGTQLSPGPDWTYVYINSSSGVLVNEYRKYNPEWETAYKAYLARDFAWFGYNPNYSCPVCLSNNTLPKTITLSYSCGIAVEDYKLMCNQVVTSITATNSMQTIKKGETLITTATATYLDGHTGVVNCTSNFNPNQNGYQTVTLTYSGLVGTAKTTGVRTCSIGVTVINKTLSYITATPTSQTIKRYGTPVFSVKAYYSDGTNADIVSNLYSLSAYDNTTYGQKTITISYTEGGITQSAATIVDVKPLQKVCTVCSNAYDLNPDDSDPGCPFCKDTVSGISVVPEEIQVFQGDSLSIEVQVLSRDGTTRKVTSWTSNYSPEVVGFQLVDVEYGGYKAAIYVTVKEKEITCLICGTNYPVFEGSCPVCRETLTSITVVPEEVTVNQYETINLVVVATYADGSMKKVEDWSIDCTTSTAGVFTANVSYGGCTYPIKLTVLSLDLITCSICGLSYDGSENPNGCPVCSEQLTGIEAYLSSGSYMLQYGSTPAISVVLIYRDSHRELTDTDYSIEGYEPTLFGIQTITIRYKEFICHLEINVVDVLNTVTCPNGHVYYLNEDGSDPGCPYCVIAQGHEVVYYYDITYTDEILEELYNTGTYSFDQNNYINISVTKKEVSLLMKLQRISVKTVLLGRKKRFQYGGEIT